MKKKTKELEVRRTKNTLQCKFTDDELRQLGKDLAEKTSLARQIEAEKKQIVKQFDARIAEAEAQISQLTHSIQSGYEYRSVDCTETLGEPDANKKTVRRLDLNTIVEVRELSTEEKQRALDFDKEQEDEAA